MKQKDSYRRGVLLRSRQSRHGEKVFYCEKGRRHWVMDGRWLEENGFTWPSDVLDVEPQVLEALLPGQSAARRRSLSDWERGGEGFTTWEMRELCVSRLGGSGIEVGAGANPMPIPLDCRIRYVDIFDASQLHDNRYDGQASPDILAPDIVATLDNLEAISASSIDFVVACHVIEHTRDPIGAIAGAWAKLRPGGSVALVVPEISRTFDRDRALTPLDHLIEDFREPDPHRLRDKPHFQEFYAKAFVTPPEEYETTWESKWAEAFPIHYHTWTHDSFMEMIGWMDSRGLLPALEEAWSRPPLPEQEGCIEFWVTLRKSN